VRVRFGFVSAVTTGFKYPNAACSTNDVIASRSRFPQPLNLIGLVQPTLSSRTRVVDSYLMDLLELSVQIYIVNLKL
jgi:hypothetical protein